MDSSGTQLLITELATVTQSFSCSFETYFDIHETARIILENNYRRIALQFPDSLLSHASHVSTLLASLTGVSMFILADTSYGSCCVDDVASQHVNADMIVHYGESCLSRRVGVPVYYVYGCGDIDVEEVVAFCVRLEGLSGVLQVHFDVEYLHAVPELKEKLIEAGVDARYDDLTRFDVGDGSLAGCKSCTCEPLVVNEEVAVAVAFPVEVSMDNLNINSQDTLQTILYIGKRGPHLSHILLLNSQSPFYTFDPSAPLNASTVSPKALLHSRYAKINACITSQIIGILVGTLGLTSYLPLINSLKHLIRRKGKGVYVMAVGKVNPEKLGNFSEVGCWVFVGCGVRGMMLEGEGKTYHRSVLTPFELVVGLESLDEGGDEERSIGWAPGADGKYELDFGKIAARLKRMIDQRPTSIDERGLVSQSGMKDVTAYVSAIEFLNSRTFKGLDMQKDVNGPAVVEKGRSGLARDYSEDVL